jgi:hypothetical protein
VRLDRCISLPGFIGPNLNIMTRTLLGFGLASAVGTQLGGGAADRGARAVS